MFSPINTPTSEQSKTGAACSLCRLKKRGCDRVKPGRPHPLLMTPAARQGLTERDLQCAVRVRPEDRKAIARTRRCPSPAGGIPSTASRRVKGLRVPYVARESGDAIAQYLVSCSRTENEACITHSTRQFVAHARLGHWRTNVLTAQKICPSCMSLLSVHVYLLRYVVVSGSNLLQASQASEIAEVNAGCGA